MRREYQIRSARKVRREFSISQVFTKFSTIPVLYFQFVSIVSSANDPIALQISIMCQGHHKNLTFFSYHIFLSKLPVLS